MRREDRLLHRFPFSLADLGGNRASSWHHHLFFCPFLLFDRAAGFLPPRPQNAEAGARRCCPGWPGSGPPIDAEHRFAMTGLALTASSTTARSSCRGLLTRAGTRVLTSS